MFHPASVSLMSERRQQNRLVSLSTPLGQDALVATSFDSVEALSQCFEIVVTAESDRDDLDFSAALGRNCAVTVKTFADERVFSGVLVEAQWTGGAAEDRTFKLVLRPWLWLLSRSYNHRTFTNLSIIDIIQKVFQTYTNDFRVNLQETYPIIEYCVQYGESDLTFVSRLMERFGLHYYFEHSKAAHTLVMVDSNLGHADLGSTVPYRPESDNAVIGADYLSRFTAERRLCTGKVSLADYDFLAPGNELRVQRSTSEGYDHADLEHYAYPGKYPRTRDMPMKQENDGHRLASIRLDAYQALDYRRYAEGDALPLFPGATFSLIDHADAGQYLVVEARHHIDRQAYVSGATAGLLGPCSSTFVLQPSSRPFRAPQLTPRPVIHGPQTAQVVSANGDEIDVDEHGRVLLRFFWDRDAQTSRRVRVAQLWSGAQWGSQFIPRTGQEVVVQFLDGDPDRPLVVGTVYNANMTPPYDLPDSKTVSGLKTQSSEGGGGFNELMFDDKKGAERVRFRAQRDSQGTVLNTETWTIGEQFETPRGQPSRTVTLKNGDDVLKVESGDLAVTVEEGDHATTVQRGDHKTAIALGDHTVTVSAGNQTVTVAQKVSIHADMKIELVAGPSSITLDPTGVTIKAPMLRLQADAVFESEAPIVKVNADGMLKLQGAITMIN